MATKVDGGYRISGIMDANFVVAVVMLGIPTADAPPSMGMALIPAGEVTARDTWHVAGLASSGSNDIVADNVFVPEHRVLPDLALFTGYNEHSRSYEPIFGFPAIPFSSFITVIPILGAAMGLLELYREPLPGRVTKGMRLPRRRCRTQHNCRCARLRMDFAFAAQLCRNAARLIADGAGSSIYRGDHSFQRLFRDIQVMSSHVAFDMDAVGEVHGRMLLGMSPNTMIL